MTPGIDLKETEEGETMGGLLYLLKDGQTDWAFLTNVQIVYFHRFVYLFIQYP